MSIKIFFLTFILAAILALALKMNSPIFVMVILFLPVSFLASLSVGAQSFTLARLPFLFLNGAVFFLLLFRDSLSDGLFVAFSAAIFFLVFWAVNYFAGFYKALPNIASEDYDKFSSRYELSRNLAFIFLFFAAFVWCVDAFVVYSIFGYPFYLSLLIIFFAIFLLTSFALRVYAAEQKEQKNSPLPAIYSWTISLVMVQASWIIGFWPFGYLTAAFIITIIYYVALSALKEYFFGTQDKARAVKEFLFGLVVVAVIFYFMRWLPA